MFTSEAEKAMEAALKQRGRVNIVIAGRTGVGKSTLINSIFQGRMAETGQGRPVTKETREITKEGIPVSIFDTRGLEMADYKATVEAVERLVQDRHRDSDPHRHIHVAWICISEDSRRVEEAESQLTHTLAKYIPVVGVITKARADQGFRAEVQKLMPEARNVVRVRAIAEQLDEGFVLQPHGLKDLVDLTMELVPEAHRNAFAAAQKANLDLKSRRAQGAIATAAAAATAAGASPIPFSDALVLVPIQVAMLAGITAIFGLPVSVGFLTTLLASVGTGAVATIAGRSIVTNLLKLIPGAGTIAGGAIAAATAAALTTAFGEVYIATLVKLMEKSGGEPPTADEILKTFKEQYAIRRK
jgi:small GTP-binding protein